MSTGFDPEKITFFAKTDARGQQVPFGIKAKDRQRHMYVVGKTGMGKSTLLENMAAQDIQNGEGMAFIDPHGSAVETLLEYVPEHRLNDVVYFAPFDLSNPISFNVMEDVGPDKRHLVVSGLMSTFKKIWVDAWSARMEYILTNALLALIEYPDTTLLSVNRLFADKAYRKQVVDYIKDPAVKAFWTEEFANYTDRFTADALPAIQNKIGQFTGNPLIRNIIGQPHSSFDIRQIMDEKKILLINLSKGLVGETNANLLGSMLTTRIYLAAMSRADLPVSVMKGMPNFYFYVDEFQSFANATFANILSEARKYHLNLIIAHQYIEQMEEEVKNAVFGNVGTTISFRVGPFDAEVLETVFTPQFLAEDLVNLGFAQIYLTLMIDGIGSPPFSATTLPPVELPRVSYKEMVIATSRQNFTKPREEVEKIIMALHTPIRVEATTNKGSQNNNSSFNKNNGSRQTRTNNSTKNYPPLDSKETLDSFREKLKSAAFLSEEKIKTPSRAGETTGEAVQQEKTTWTEKKTATQKETRDTLMRQNNSETKPKNSLADLRSVLQKISTGNQSSKKPIELPDEDDMVEAKPVEFKETIIVREPKKIVGNKKTPLSPDMVVERVAKTNKLEIVTERKDGQTMALKKALTDLLEKTKITNDQEGASREVKGEVVGEFPFSTGVDKVVDKKNTVVAKQNLNNDNKKSETNIMVKTKNKLSTIKKDAEEKLLNTICFTPQCILVMEKREAERQAKLAEARRLIAEQEKIDQALRVADKLAARPPHEKKEKVNQPKIDPARAELERLFLETEEAFLELENKTKQKPGDKNLSTVKLVGDERSEKTESAKNFKAGKEGGRVWTGRPPAKRAGDSKHPLSRQNLEKRLRGPKKERPPFTG